MPSLSFHTALGALTLSEEDGIIVALDWGWGRDQTETPVLVQGRAEVQAFLEGSLQRFSVPVRPHGSAYRQAVWAALCRIPYGITVSYARLAAEAGGSARSIGGANGANPVPIIIPCHRVVGSHGLGGYSGGDGIETKRWLLALEARNRQVESGTSLQIPMLFPEQPAPGQANSAHNIKRQTVFNRKKPKHRMSAP